MDLSRLPTPVAESWDWQLRGACRDVDNAGFFYPERERGANRRRSEERAKTVCRACPVLSECREYALVTREPYGVWGAMTPLERRIELAAMQRTAA
jgi:WhiB family redox-sensing transcriptional regulator